MIENDNINNSNEKPIEKYIDKKSKFSRKIFMIGLILIGVGLTLGLASSQYIRVNKYASNQEITNAEAIYIKELSLEPFQNIAIDVSMADIEFIESDKYGISIGYYESKQGYEIKYKLEDNKLKVEDNFEEVNQSLNDSYNRMFFNFNDYDQFNYDKPGYVKVYIPVSNKEPYNLFNEINIKNLEGDISLNIFNDILKCSDLNINTISSNIKLGNISSQDIEIYAEEGKSTIRNLSANRLNYTNAYGNAVFDKITNIPGSELKVNISMQNGEIEISNINSKDMVFNNYFGDSKFDNIISDYLEVNIQTGNFDISKSNLEYLDYTNESGNSKFNNMNITSVKSQSLNGEFKILDSMIKKLHISSENGNIDLSNTIVVENLNMDSTNGNIKANGQFSGNLAIDSINGNVELTTSIDNQDYNYNLRTMGTLIIDGKEHTNDSDEGINIAAYKQEGYKNNIDIKSDSGNVILNFK